MNLAAGLVRVEKLDLAAVRSGRGGPEVSSLLADRDATVGQPSNVMVIVAGSIV